MFMIKNPQNFTHLQQGQQTDKQNFGAQGNNSEKQPQKWGGPLKNLKLHEGLLGKD